MVGIIERDLEINIPKGSLPAKIISPTWAKGFECKPKFCGLCCICEKPENVPTKYFKPLDMKICVYFDIEKKLCKEYEKRPWGCKAYPFLFGVHNGLLTISPSLECPTTNKSEINIEDVKETFADSVIARIVEGTGIIFERAKQSKFWCEGEYFWSLLSKKVSAFFGSGVKFPLLSKMDEMIMNFHDNFFGITIEHPKYPPIHEIISTIVKNKGGIATTFQSNEMYSARIKGLKAIIFSWDPRTGKTEKSKARLPLKPQELEVDREATEILKDYISLLLRRPFLSLATVYLEIIPRPIPTILASSLLSSFVHLEAGAYFFAYKHPDATIDKNAMREIISFADGCLLGQFRNPRQSIR